MGPNCALAGPGTADKRRMQIPSLHLDAQRLAGLGNIDRHAPRTGGEDTGGVRRGGDSLELSSDRPGSPAARVARFAEKIEQRLAKLAESLGPDGQRLLAAATEKFQSNIDRIQAALADGTLSRSGLKNALANTMEGLRDDLGSGGVDLHRGGRVLPPGELTAAGVDRVRGDGGDEGSSDVKRVENLAAGIDERIQKLAAETGGAAGEALKSALAAFHEHVQRILAGLADGSLGADGLENALQNTLQMVKDDVQRALGVGDPDDGERGARREIEDVVGHAGPDSISLYGRSLGVETLGDDGAALDTTV